MIKNYFETLVKNNKAFSEYLDETLDSDKILITQRTAIAAVSLFLLFGIVDIMSASSSVMTILSIRAIVSIIILILLTLSIYKKEFFIQNYGVIVTFVYSMCGVAIELMILFSEDHDLLYMTYFAGIMLVIIGMFSWVYLNTVVSLITAFVLIGFYIVVFYIKNSKEELQDLHLILINNVFFLLAAIVVGLIADILRKHYLHRHFLAQKRLREILIGSQPEESLETVMRKEDSLGLSNLKPEIKRLISDAKVANLSICINCISVNEGTNKLISEYIQKKIFTLIYPSLNNPNTISFFENRFYYAFLFKESENEAPVFSRNETIKTNILLGLNDKKIKLKHGISYCSWKEFDLGNLIKEAENNLTNNQTLKIVKA